MREFSHIVLVLIILLILIAFIAFIAFISFSGKKFSKKNSGFDYSSWKPADKTEGEMIRKFNKIKNSDSKFTKTSEVVIKNKNLDVLAEALLHDVKIIRINPTRKQKSLIYWLKSRYQIHSVVL